MAYLHISTTFHNQSADISASEGRPLADFRRIGEHSDCFANTVWAPRASLFVKQSIGGAARQENQQVASGSGDIALDYRRPSLCKWAIRKPSSQTLPLGFCPVDQESGAHTTRQTGRCVGIAEREIHGFYRKKECATISFLTLWELNECRNPW